MAEYAEIVRDIQQGKYAPVYFLQGDEPFFIDNIIEHIENNALDDAQKSFNQYVLYGKEIDFAQILTAARKYPMMGERQVVIVKEAQELRGWNKEENQQLLMAYLENPLASTILVFGYKYKTLDKRTKVGKSLEKHAVFLHSKKIYDNQVPSWIQSYSSARQVKLTSKAVMLLAENIGNNLQRLSNEIEKLLLNVKDGQEIDERIVHKYVGISKEYNTFELQHALSSKNMAKAIKIVNYFASNPSNNPLILTIFNLFSYFSKLLLVHQSSSKDKNTISKAIGVHPFFAEEYVRASSHYSLPVVLRNIEFIHDADLRSKGINGNVRPDGELLKELVFKLMT
ncbi:MAG: DNA polymerase III subunit delta [Cyclobacteriaceae bacterium]|nr:DNA polymerase III subunit delta [Cyclobacteriaceae bacterium HetDA_MAG_MS6]